MVTLYITRHGETEWNRENKVQGWRDSNLTIAGKKSANLLGERVKPVHFDAVFSNSITIKTLHTIFRNRTVEAI
ncbi:histidine phosphatase family protein [Bacillus sp. JCM 19041]|uniref:histidine phosphatase family protein n=1 Tax=Bacillus sp. JCM 19041 TaxID=1460637 RepID=UPI0006D1F31F